MGKLYAIGGSGDVEWSDRPETLAIYGTAQGARDVIDRLNSEGWWEDRFGNRFRPVVVGADEEDIVMDGVRGVLRAGKEIDA